MYVCMYLFLPLKKQGSHNLEMPGYMRLPNFKSMISRAGQVIS